MGIRIQMLKAQVWVFKMMHFCMNLRASTPELDIALEKAKELAKTKMIPWSDVFYLQTGGGIYIAGVGVLACHPLIALHELGHAYHQHPEKQLERLKSGESITADSIRAREEEANLWAAQFVPPEWVSEWYKFVRLNQDSYSEGANLQAIEVGTAKYKYARTLLILKGETVHGEMSRRERFVAWLKKNEIV